MGRQGNSTINDVARLANVSKKTVSRVINKSPLLSDKTRLHVEKIISDIGYVPNPQARALALRHNFILAVIHDNPNAQFLVNVQNGMLDGMKGTDFGLMVQPVDRNSSAVIEEIKSFIERHRPYGILLLPPISYDNQLAKLCEDYGTRYVRMASLALDKPEHSIISNDRNAVEEAVSYLIAQGHKKIGLIEGAKGFVSAGERRAGYEQAMQKAGLIVPNHWVAAGAYTFDSGYEAAALLLDQSDRPTALFAANDEMAIGAMMAARERQIDIPKDLSIIGFDDTPLSAHIWPPLTTVRWPIFDMAKLAAKRLIENPQHDSQYALQNKPDNIFLSSALIKRATVVKI